MDARPVPTPPSPHRPVGGHATPPAGERSARRPDGSIPQRVPGGAPPGTRQGTGRDEDNERGLRALAGAGATQVTASTAVRVREACQPTPDDLAAADRDLPIVLRGWRPDSTLPGYLTRIDTTGHLARPTPPPDGDHRAGPHTAI